MDTVPRIASTAGAALRAVVIGIDHYAPNATAAGEIYSGLKGAVRDALEVSQFLRERAGADQITLLLSRSGEGVAPAGECRPSYEVMVNALVELSDSAAPGDRLHVHYSGHGGRAVTAYPELKGEDGVDEVFVPWNIGEPGARYLRDVEFAFLLQRMVAKGLVLSVVIDSCHAGGVTKKADGHGADRRGGTFLDKTVRATDSDVAGVDELAATWHALKVADATASGVGGRGGGGWVPTPRGYVLLCACGASEAAHEYDVDRTGRRGALTYWLVDTLNAYGLGPRVTYQRLYERVAPRVRARFPAQTPILEGDTHRAVFGVGRELEPASVIVIRSEPHTGKLWLSAGAAHGVRPGAVFAVGLPGLDDARGRGVLVRVTRVDDASSEAVVTAGADSGVVEAGSRAELADVGPDGLRRRVREVNLPPSLNWAAAMDKGGAGFLAHAADDEPADFEVAVGAAGMIEIRDPFGVSLRHLEPPVKVTDRGAAGTVVSRLVHLARYAGVLELENRLVSRLDAGFSVEVQVAAAPGVPRWGSDRLGNIVMPDGSPAVFATPTGSPPSVNADCHVRLVCTNRTAGPLHLALLVLLPNWSVTQIMPGPGRGATIALDAGQQKGILVQMDLPGGADEELRVYKLCVSDAAIDFRVHELPVVGSSAAAKAGDAVPKGHWAIRTIAILVRPPAPRPDGLVRTDPPRGTDR